MKIAVVAHDAGGSELIAAWVREHPENEYIFYLEGPAVSIFNRRLNRNFTIYKHDRVKAGLHGIDLVVTSSSWGSDIEKRAWIWAQDENIESVLYADGWSDFRNTFWIEKKNFYPRKVWITSEMAREKMLAVGVPPDRIEVVENFYLRQMKERVESIAKDLQLKPHENRILFCAENISSCEAAYEIKADDVLRGYDEYEALSGFLRLVEAGQLGEKPIIRVRPHPSEVAAKYEEIVAAYSGLSIEFSSPGVSLEEDLAWATQVVGCETMALALAVGCGKRSISCVPAKARIECRLPLSELIRLRS